MATVRSRRSLNMGSNRTPAVVGPGSYDLRREEPTQPSYTAFCSTEERGFNKRNAGAELPGPGNYDVGGSQTAREVPASRKGLMATTAPRFAPMAPGSSAFTESSVIENPGPGAYNLAARAGGAAGSPQRPRTHAAVTVQPPRQPPSIPSARESLGYVRGPAGTLLLKTGAPGAARGRGSAGAAGRPRQPRQPPAPQQHGAMERSTARRTVFEPSCAYDNNIPPTHFPGPGQYNVRSAPTSGVGGFGGDGPSAAFASRVPKAHNRGASELEDEAPGPGTYSLPGMGVGGGGGGGGPRPGRRRQAQAAPQQQPMGQGGDGKQGRMGWSNPFKTNVPGPGSYGDTRTSFKPYARKVLTEELVGFSATGERDCLRPERVERRPGPGQYQPQNDLQSSVRNRGGVGRNGIFGTTSRRFIERDFQEIVDEPGPGPGQYGDINPGIVPKRRAFASVFRSTAPRFQERVTRSPDHLVVGVTVAPSVGEYNLPSTFKEPEADPVERAPFATSAVRFGVGSALEVSAGASPGPQAYSAHRVGSMAASNAARHARARLPKERRFKRGSADASTPQSLGPGTYDVSSSFTRKTFNVTMGGLS